MSQPVKTPNKQKGTPIPRKVATSARQREADAKRKARDIEEEASRKKARSAFSEDPAERAARGNPVPPQPKQAPRCHAGKSLPAEAPKARKDMLLEKPGSSEDSSTDSEGNSSMLSD